MTKPKIGFIGIESWVSHYKNLIKAGYPIAYETNREALTNLVKVPKG